VRMWVNRSAAAVVMSAPRMMKRLMRGREVVVFAMNTVLKARVLLQRRRMVANLVRSFMGPWG